MNTDGDEPACKVASQRVVGSGLIVLSEIGYRFFERYWNGNDLE